MVQIGFQLPTYGQKKKEEEQMMSKAPMMSVASPVNKEVQQTSQQKSMGGLSNRATGIPREPMMSYAIEGTIMPGLTDTTAKNIQKYAKEQSKTPEEEKLLLNDMYQEAVKLQQRKAYEKDRQEMKAQMVQKSLSTTDQEEKKAIDVSIKLANLSDIIREGAKKEGVDAFGINDKDLVARFGEGNQQYQQSIVDYLNGKIDSVGFANTIGLIEKETEETMLEGDNNKSLLGMTENVVGGAYDSATGLSRFIATNLAKGVGWIAKKLGADENKVQELVDSYIESTKDLSGEAIGADTQSGLYKGTKMVGDIAQIANPAGLGKAGLKAGQMAAKIGKEGSLLAKAAKGATVGAVDTAVFMPQSEQRMATGKELAIGAVAGGALPIAGVGLNAAKKGISKIAPKLELSGLLNPSKLNTVKERLIQEGVEKADALDVGKWMLDRGIKGNKEQIVSQLDNLANQSKKAVDDILGKSTTLFKNTTADDLLEKLAQEYDGSIAQAGRDKFNKIQGLIEKSKKEGLTLTELNDVKRMVWDLDPYTATGKVKVSKADLAGANSELKTFIEKSAAETIEGVDENMIKMLNNETQTARGLSEGISKKESADAVREIVNFMAGRSPGAIVGGTVGYQQGGDWKSTIIGALAGGTLGSTSMKTKAANILYKTFSKQEQTVLQKFIQSGGAEKLSPKIIDKLDDLSTKIKSPKAMKESITMPRAMVKAPEEPLMAEARKYKSAEEFIKAQSIYHGTSNKIEGGALAFGKGSQLRKGGSAGGLFLTDNPKVADVFSFGGEVYQANPTIKSQVLDLTKQENIKLFKDFIGKKYKDIDGEILEFTKQDFDYMFPNGKVDFASLNQDLAQQIAKQKGKIGVAFDEYAGDTVGKTYQIFEGEVPVYTKQQLKQIREEANKAKGIKLPTKK